MILAMKKSAPILLTMFLTLGLAACGQSDTSTPANNAQSTASNSTDTAINASDEMTKDTDAASNPFYQSSSLYMKFPAFDKISNADFAPAFEKGMADNLVEINTIANNPEPATFENTMVAMEEGGQILSRTASVFFALSSANTNDDIIVCADQRYS